ncbi:hypothetical protein MJD09_13585 [bacterium]|nr:hypothetical protein [bacterium]
MKDLKSTYSTDTLLIRKYTPEDFEDCQHAIASPLPRFRLLKMVFVDFDRITAMLGSRRSSELGGMGASIASP